MLAALLAGCTSLPERMMNLGQVENAYPPPLARADYAYFVHGFYVRRDLKVTDGVIAYDVLWDNRPLKQQIASRMTVTEKFKKKYPALIRHQGKTDCKSNSFTLTRYDESMRVVRQELGNGMTEAAQALCMVMTLIEQQHD